MGLFSKMVNYVTGGSAQVDVDIDDASLSTPFSARVTAEIHDDNLKIEKVYLRFRCTEGKLAGYIEEDKITTDNERILQEMNEWDIKTIFRTDVDVVGETELVSGESYQWTTQVDLSEAEFPSKKTDGYEIRWEVQAGIDVPGNDPDSGWVKIDVGP